ncbi:probable NAD kinase 2, chloroplastic [Magnolia sinica]|uniref:probable NAD kinase 2, chloroplastic n=1 Tax=Magnolia sinica TaxID=86752 RepID=UPI00265AE44E|nr:probable NAD kinase 2, chloroplastic [Magnolia sinica]
MAVVACPCRLCLSSSHHHHMNPFAVPLGHALAPLHLSPFPRETTNLFGAPAHHRKESAAAALRFVAAAAATRLSTFFSSKIGLDTQTFHTQDLSQLPWVGPIPGDLAEVEAYCRIFRAAEQLHVAVMETLCNPLTGECTISYEIPSEDMLVLEEKVVAVLGCMVALLNREREDVLAGRSSLMNSFQISDVNILDGKLPPLAIFRGEMKRCCESLFVALEKYLTPFDDRSTNIWRKLQRLRNVCYDAGFPCGPDDPCQMVFANWTSVCLTPTKEDIGSNDCEIAFWTGGQVTDEGLKWLMEKGYKTIVDLRAEAVKDEYYQAAVERAVACGEIDLVKLPVEVGTAPSMEQVEAFAAMVSDISKRPLYLHSQEGVRRTSAMVSRWRQYSARYLSVIPTQPGNLNEVPSKNMKENGNGNLGAQNLIPQEGSLLKDANGSLPKELDSVHSSSRVFHKQGYQILEKEHHSGNGAPDAVACQYSGSIHGADGVEVGALMNFSREIDPLKSQVPTCDVFSKREMSGFFRNRKISPVTFFNCQRKRYESLLVPRERRAILVQDRQIIVDARASGEVQSRSSNGAVGEKGLFSRPHNSSSTNGKYLTDDTPASVGLAVNGFGEGESSMDRKPKISTHGGDNLTKKIVSTSVEVDKKNTAKVSLPSVDVGLEIDGGDMCTSATGVVRVQSRKKAEMFLVRTDGFSCTREKVTESSLAFTHPSTQQQMLMWKSTPKTVLLLKKLGQELMEQAKEVASFLYYQEKMNVLVEPDVHDIFARIPGFGFVQTFYNQDTSDLHERVDFVACLGGDGVILHASNLFRGAVPPVVSFNLGSLGFLTSHTFEEFRKDLGAVIHGNNTVDGVYITLRMRLRCEIFRNGKAVPGKVFDVLNEVVVDRGSNPYLSKIECYEHNRLITKVQGDGVIVATPTGSTAYSTAAGGSMVHPNVPCMLFTPICPHSLSFRPVILPDSAQLELKIPEDTRSNAWVSFDGKRRQQLSRGDSIRISMSQHPLPTVNKRDQTGDWFRSLIRCLNWNERLDQKAL